MMPIQAMRLRRPGLIGWNANVAADNPVGWWKFNESAGATTFVDSGSGGNDLLANGNPVAGASGLWGNTGNAVVLDGSGDYLRPADSTDLRSNLDITLELLISFAAIPTSGNAQVICRCSGNVTDDSSSTTNTLYSFVLQNSGGTVQVQCFHESGVGTNNIVNIPYTFIAATRYHLVFTRDVTTNTYEMWVNGTSVGSGNYTNDPSGGANATFGFGRGVGETVDLNATIDEAALYGSKLSSTRIAAHYASLV